MPEVHRWNRWRNRKFRLRVPRLASRNDEALYGPRDDRWSDDDGVPVSATSATDIAIPLRRSHAVVPVIRETVKLDKSPSKNRREACSRDRARVPAFVAERRNYVLSCPIYVYCGCEYYHRTYRRRRDGT